MADWVNLLYLFINLGASISLIVIAIGVIYIAYTLSWIRCIFNYWSEFFDNYFKSMSGGNK